MTTEAETPLIDRYPIGDPRRQGFANFLVAGLSEWQSAAEQTNADLRDVAANVQEVVEAVGGLPKHTAGTVTFKHHITHGLLPTPRRYKSLDELSLDLAEGGRGQLGQRIFEVEARGEASTRIVQVNMPEGATRDNPYWLWKKGSDGKVFQLKVNLRNTPKVRFSTEPLAYDPT